MLLLKPFLVRFLAQSIGALLIAVRRRNQEEREAVVVCVSMVTAVEDEGSLDGEDAVLVPLAVELVPVDAVLPQVLRKAHLAAVQLTCKRKEGMTMRKTRLKK